MTDEGTVEIRGDGGRKHVPLEVVGRDIGLDGPGKVVERDWGTINQIDVNNHHKVNWSVWICS